MKKLCDISRIFWILIFPSMTVVSTVFAEGISSSVTWVAVSAAQQFKIPFLVNSASEDRITERGWEYVFRLNPPVSEHPKTLGSFLKTVAKARSMGIIYENTPF